MAMRNLISIVENASRQRLYCASKYDKPTGRPSFLKSYKCAQDDVENEGDSFIFEYEIRFETVLDAVSDAGDPFITVNFLVRELGLTADQISYMKTLPFWRWLDPQPNGDGEPNDWFHSAEDEMPFEGCYAWASNILFDDKIVGWISHAGYDAVRTLDSEDEPAFFVIDGTRVRYVRTIDPDASPDDTETDGSLF